MKGSFCQVLSEHENGSSAGRPHPPWKNGSINHSHGATAKQLSDWPDSALLDGCFEAGQSAMEITCK